MVNGLIVGPGAWHAGYEGHNDFQVFYIGGKLAGDPGLYDSNRAIAVDRQLFGESNPHRIPSRLPFYYAMLSPLGRLSYRAAVFVWVGGLLLASVLFVALYPCADRTILAITCCWSLPLVFSLAQGTDIALVLLTLGAALNVFYGRKPFLAGLLLSFCLIKFNLFLLLPVLVLQKRAWRLAAGLLSGSVLLLLISFAVAGWGWPRAYASMLLNPNVSPGSAVMPNLHGLAADFHLSATVELVLSLLVAGLVYLVNRRAPFELALAATLLGGILLSRHAYVHDCAILIPGLLALLRSRDHFLIQACALTLLVPFQYALSLEQGAITAALVLLLIAALAFHELRGAGGSLRFR
jgi:hypothetical protein